MNSEVQNFPQHHQHQADFKSKNVNWLMALRCNRKCFVENSVEILVEFFGWTCFCYYYCRVPLPKTTVICLLLTQRLFIILLSFFWKKRFLHTLLIQPTTHTFLFNKTFVFTPPSCRKQLWRSLIICHKIHPQTSLTLDPPQYQKKYHMIFLHLI